MKVKNVRQFLAAGMLSLSVFGASSAHATIISADDSIFGAGALTHDTDQGLDFLDTTFPAGLTIAEVDAELASGGSFFGFRWATNDEMVSLINNWGFSPGAQAHVNVTGNTGTDQIGGLIDLLAPTATSWIDLAIGSTATSTIGLYNYTDLGSGNDGVYWNGRAAGGNNSFLVRESLTSAAVPEGGTTMALMGLALVGVAGYRRVV